MIKSVQIAATFYDAVEETFEVCALDQANHISVYVRDEHGEVEPVADYKGTAGLAKSSALSKAAKLSMEHGAFIEPNKDFM